jgi:ABC-type cobalamin/Fe3+-siderophores transport system ATPase subunit
MSQIAKILRMECDQRPCHMLWGLAREHALAIVISTHELELALRVADRVWLLDALPLLPHTWRRALRRLRLHQQTRHQPRKGSAMTPAASDTPPIAGKGFRHG